MQLFTVAKIRKQPRCLSLRLTDKENTHTHIHVYTHTYININTHIYIPTMDYYSVTKKKELFLAFYNMDEP